MSEYNSSNAIPKKTRLREEFVHRHNVDGSYDSICTHCARTVGTSRDERELHGAETAHDCIFAYQKKPPESIA